MDGTGIPVLPKLSLEETDWAGAGGGGAVGGQWDTSFVKIHIKERTDTYMK